MARPTTSMKKILSLNRNLPRNQLITAFCKPKKRPTGRFSFNGWMSLLLTSTGVITNG